jgi:predicted nucleic acid-binding protein
MKVLDATFLIDYLEGREATREFHEENRGEQIRWVVPIPALAEVLVGEDPPRGGRHGGPYGSRLGRRAAGRRANGYHGRRDC